MPCRGHDTCRGATANMGLNFKGLHSTTQLLPIGRFASTHLSRSARLPGGSCTVGFLRSSVPFAFLRAFCLPLVPSYLPTLLPSCLFPSCLPAFLPSCPPPSPFLAFPLACIYSPSNAPDGGSGHLPSRRRTLDRRGTGDRCAAAVTRPLAGGHLRGNVCRPRLGLRDRQSYLQDVYPPFNRFGGKPGGQRPYSGPTHRELKSDLLLVRPVGADGWMHPRCH